MPILDECCDFINGGAWSDKEYVEKGIPVLKVSNMQRGGIDYSNLDCIPEKSLVKYARHRLRKDDLVIATVGSHPSLVNSAAGRAIIIPRSAEGYLLNQNAVCVRSKDSATLNQKYLAYIGKTDFFQHYIQQRGKGAANQMRIAIGEIKGYSLELPPLSTQQKIASILSAYDDLIENNLKRIKLLEEIAQRTYEEWFVKFRINGEELTIDEGTGLPEGWKLKKIGESCYVSGGGTPSRAIAEYWDGGKIEWYSPTDLSKSKSIYQSGSADKITELGLSKSSAKLLEPNSFMMTSRATIGLFGIVDKSFCTNQGFINVTPFQTEHKEYLFYNFLSRVDEFKGYATGATFPELSKSKFKALEIIWPSDNALSQFHAITAPIHKQLATLSKHNNSLKEARDILLPRLMNGEIDVEEVKEKASAVI